MSNLDKATSELQRQKEYDQSVGRSRLKTFAVTALLVLATMAGLAEIHLLPTFNAEEFSCILFGMG